MGCAHCWGSRTTSSRRRGRRPRGGGPASSLVQARRRAPARSLRRGGLPRHPGGAAGHRGAHAHVVRGRRGLFESIMAGAAGYVLKEIRGTELVEGIRRSRRAYRCSTRGSPRRVLERIRNPGPARLTPTEHRILEMIADGLTNGSAAAAGADDSSGVPAQPPGHAVDQPAPAALRRLGGRLRDGRGGLPARDRPGHGGAPVDRGGAGVGNGALFALAGRRVPTDQVGSVTGVVGAAGGLGGFLPPIVMGVGVPGHRLVRDQGSCCSPTSPSPPLSSPPGASGPPSPRAPAERCR